MGFSTCHAVTCVIYAYGGRLKKPGYRIGWKACHLTRNVDHIAHQPFGQIPWLTDGGISIFESGAILPHLGFRNRAKLNQEIALRLRTHD